MGKYLPLSTIREGGLGCFAVAGFSPGYFYLYFTSSPRAGPTYANRHACGKTQCNNRIQSMFSRRVALRSLISKDRLLISPCNSNNPSWFVPVRHIGPGPSPAYRKEKYIRAILFSTICSKSFLHILSWTKPLQVLPLSNKGDGYHIFATILKCIVGRP